MTHMPQAAGLIKADYRVATSPLPVPVPVPVRKSRNLSTGLRASGNWQAAAASLAVSSSAHQHYDLKPASEPAPVSLQSPPRLNPRTLIESRRG